MSVSRRLIVDSEIRNFYGYIRIALFSQPLKGLLFISFFGSFYYIADTFQYSIAIEITRFIKIFLFWSLIFFVTFALYLCIRFFADKKKMVDMELLYNQLEMARRPMIIRTSSNTLFVKINIFKNYTFCYVDSGQLTEIEKMLRSAINH